jgi:glycosyltransferase involved in cell wall biosynthesis
MMIGPYPRSLARIDGGVSAATTYLSQALAQDPDIELIGVTLAGRAKTRGAVEYLGWPVEQLELGRFSVSTMFTRQRRQFDALLKRYRPDIVHAQGADAAGYLAVKSGAPAIVTIHGILSECAKLRTDPIRRLRELVQARITEHLVVERARNVVTISPYVARYYQDRLRGRLHEIPNAVSPAFFGIPRNPIRGRVLFAGRISRGKGVLDLLAAASREPREIERLVLAGASPEKEFAAGFVAEVQRMNLAHRVTVTGLLDEDALVEEFARASVLVLPSYQETAPMVLQQAMAAGLPVIATRVGGIPDLVRHDESGLLFEPGDVDELCSHLRRLGKDSGLSDRLARAGKALAKSRFDARSVAAATKRAYSRMAEERLEISGRQNVA